MPKLDFRVDLLKRLKSPKQAQGYLEAALADDDPGSFLEALKDVVEAQSISSFAKRTKLSRAGLERSFSPAGDPTFRDLFAVLEALGYRFKLERRTAINFDATLIFGHR